MAICVDLGFYGYVGCGLSWLNLGGSLDFKVFGKQWISELDPRKSKLFAEESTAIGFSIRTHEVFSSFRRGQQKPSRSHRQAPVGESSFEKNKKTRGGCTKCSTDQRRNELLSLRGDRSGSAFFWGKHLAWQTPVSASKKADTGRPARCAPLLFFALANKWVWLKIQDLGLRGF